MKPAFYLVSAALLTLGALPAFAQTDAGTPQINPNTNGSLPGALKVTPSAQPGTLTAGKSSYKSGEKVKMTFRVTNTSGKSVTYNFSTGQRFDIAATRGKGLTVWNWAHNKLFTQNLASLSLLPGKSFVYTAAWNGRDLAGHPAAPGVYTLQAHLTSDNRPAITGGVVVNTDSDPTNMGHSTRTPADSGAIRQVAPAPQVSAKTTVTIK